MKLSQGRWKIEKGKFIPNKHKTIRGKHEIYTEKSTWARNISKCFNECFVKFRQPSDEY